jgi:CRP-like cAMP-binding protein
VITRRDFRRLLDDAPDLQFKLLQEIGKRLEQLASVQAPRRIRLRY